MRNVLLATGLAGLALGSGAAASPLLKSRVEAGGAHKTTVTGTITAGGPAVPVTISTAGDNARLTFDGTVGQRVSVQATNSTISTYALKIVKPGGTTLVSTGTLTTGSTYAIDATQLPVAGSYSLDITPSGGATGSVTLTLYDIPADFSGTITPGGAAAPVTTSVPGQNGQLTFSGTAGQRVSVSTSGSTLGSWRLYLRRPDTTTLTNTGALSTGGTFAIDATQLPDTGTYSLFVNPTGATIGSVTLTLYDIPADFSGAITPGGAAAPVTTSVPGQNGQLTFSVTAGQRVSVSTSGSTLGSWRLYLRRPDTSTLTNTGALSIGGTFAIDATSLPDSGIYSLFVDPTGGTIGSVTLTLFEVPADPSISISVDGDPAIVNLGVPGQNAELPFSGEAGQGVFLNRGGVTIPTSHVKILAPSGSTVVSSTAGTSDASDSAQLAVTGTYKAIVDPIGGAIGTMTLSVSTDPEEIGGLADDQTAAIADDTTSNPAEAAPISPAGGVPPGSYTTELWDATEAGIDDGLQVIDSTAAGTAAITGVVKDASTEEPVSGASVVLSGAPTSISTTTSVSGAFAFINVPPGIFSTTVSASGYGLYQLLDSALDADESYQVTAALTPSPQTYSDSEDAEALQSAAAGPGSAYSGTRVPPTMIVKMYNVYLEGTSGGLNCFKRPDDQQPSVIPIIRYPSDYYILRVAKAETLDRRYNQVGQKAFFALAQNYGWYHKTLGGGYDVVNHTDHQCFRDYKSVPKRWRAWVRDVLDERIVGGNNKLIEAQYRGGTQTVCNDPAYPAGATPGIASQRVIKALSENNDCPLRTNWRDISTYFYAGSRVVAGAKPSLPKTSVSFSSGRIVFGFTSKVLGVNVAWKFRVQRKAAEGWRTVAFMGWHFRPVNTTGCSAPARSVPTCATYTPPSGCYLYRVQAGNPVGWSLAARFAPPGIGLSSTAQCQP